MPSWEIRPKRIAFMRDTTTSTLWNGCLLSEAAWQICHHLMTVFKAAVRPDLPQLWKSWNFDPNSYVILTFSSKIQQFQKKCSGHPNNNHETDRPFFLWVDKDLLLLDKQGRRPLELMDWVEGRMGIVFRTWAFSTKYFFEKVLGRVPKFFHHGGIQNH